MCAFSLIVCSVYIRIDSSVYAYAYINCCVMINSKPIVYICFCYIYKVACRTCMIFLFCQFLFHCYCFMFVIFVCLFVYFYFTLMFACGSALIMYLSIMTQYANSDHISSSALVDEITRERCKAFSLMQRENLSLFRIFACKIVCKYCSRIVVLRHVYALYAMLSSMMSLACKRRGLVFNITPVCRNFLFR